jgi:hypothetical protein
MFGVICWTILCVLALRSLLLIFAIGKPAAIRLLNFLFFLFFAASAVFVFAILRSHILVHTEVGIISFVILMIPIGILTLHKSRRPYMPQPVLFLLKALLVMVVVIACLLAVMMSGFQYLTKDRPVLKVLLTGEQKKVLVEWQPPNGTPRKETLTSYEVHFQTPEGAPVTQLYVYGDQVAAKARILRFTPILNAVGIHNLCKIEYIHNSYDTAKRFNQYPHKAWEIRTAHPWIEPYQEKFWNFWGKYYRQEDKNAWVKSATLESTYFPLVQPDGTAFKGSYFLTVTSGGLSSVPLP